VIVNLNVGVKIIKEESYKVSKILRKRKPTQVLIINKNYCVKQNKYWHLIRVFPILNLFYVHVPVGSCLGKHKGFGVSNLPELRVPFYTFRNAVNIQFCSLRKY